jgi:hypothetical protein
MPVEVPCPGCGLKLKAPENMAGKKAKCKKCATAFRVPGPPPAAESAGDGAMLSAMALPAPFAFDDPPAPDVASLPSADPFDFAAPAARPAPPPPPPAPKPAPAPKSNPEAKPAPAAKAKPASTPPGSRPAFGAAKPAAAVAPPAATPAPAKPSAAKPKPAPDPDAPLEAELLPPDADTTPDRPAAAAADTADPFSFGGPADRAEPNRRRDRDEDDEDDRPRSRRRDDRDDEDDDRRGRRRRDDDEDDRPRGRRRDDRDDRGDDREPEKPRYRAGGPKSGNALKYAAILGVVAVGAAAAAVVVYVKAKREEAAELARLKAEREKKDEPPPPDPPAPKDDGKGGKTDPKKEPPKKEPEPKKAPAGPAFAIPVGAKVLATRPVAAPGPVLQAADPARVAVSAGVGDVRQVFPADDGDGRDVVVVSVPNPGAGGKGQKVAVETYSPATGAKGKGFDFDGDGSAVVKCDVSPDGKRFAAAGPDGKVSVWSLADGSKVVDGFDPYGELGDGGKRHKEDGLAAVYFTKTPGHLLTVSSAGFVHLFNPAGPKGEKKVQGTGPSGVLTAGKVARGRNVAVDESRSVLVLAAYGSVYRYDTGTLGQLGKIDLGAEVTRPLALGVSVGTPGHVVFAFETEPNGKRERGLMLVQGGKNAPAKPEPVFYHWPDPAGEASAVDWSGEKVAVVSTAKGAMWVEYDAEAKRLFPFAVAEVPGGKAVHAASERDRHWYLLPDPARPTGSQLLALRWPPDGTPDLRQDALSGNQLHVLRLDDKGLSK